MTYTNLEPVVAYLFDLSVDMSYFFSLSLLLKNCLTHDLVWLLLGDFSRQLSDSLCAKPHGYNETKENDPKLPSSVHFFCYYNFSFGVNLNMHPLNEIFHHSFHDLKYFIVEYPSCRISNLFCRRFWISFIDDESADCFQFQSQRKCLEIITK